MGKSNKVQQKLPAYDLALQKLRQHYLLAPVMRSVSYYPVKRYQGRTIPGNAYCEIAWDTVIFNQDLRLNEASWLGVFSLAALILALGGPRRLKVPSSLSDQAAQLAALHWWNTLRIGTLPEHFLLPSEVMQWGRLPLEEIAERLQHDTLAEGLIDGEWTLTRSASVILMKPRVTSRWSSPAQQISPESLFAQALVDNAKRALQEQHDSTHPPRPGGNPNSIPSQAKRWLITHFPLLGSLLTQFELIEDLAVCHRMNISIAAIQVGIGEIYINPARNLGLEQAKFVIAHEILHAGLCHSSRRQGRDPYLWNVACDFVINDWLVAMNVGIPPDDGLLFDEELRGWSAEDIYLRLAADLRIRRRLCTLRGTDVDMLDDVQGRYFTDREEFCRRALLQGLDFHQASGRGTLPEGLVEAIRTLNQPPIPWQAKLADWIRERFPLPERKRTYAKPSRRQSATPDIPRPRFYEPDDERSTRTFGVVVDTSGSMQRDDLGKALGAIVSYSQAQGVKFVRLVYCDAAPYDEGWVSVDSLATRVSVRGRGGTVLQPAIHLLESRQDFSADCPVLVITDGFCETDLQIKRDHAFLLAPGGRLPFATRKPVFQMV